MWLVADMLDSTALEIKNPLTIWGEKSHGIRESFRLAVFLHEIDGGEEIGKGENI